MTLLSTIFYELELFLSKTASERQKSWISKNPCKAKEQNAKRNRLYRQRMKNSMKEAELRVERQKNAERKRLWRLKKKTEAADKHRSAPFSTPQVKGKLLKRTRETLKGLPEQNVHVLKALLSEYAENEPLPSSVSANKSLPEATLTKVNECYFNDAISRSSPNMKDFVTIVENGNRKKLSVKHLMFPISEIYGMFCMDNPDVKISRSKFFELRPVNILSFTKMPHNVCCCFIHENMRCRLTSLRKAHPFFKEFNTNYNMHKNFVCKDEMDTCFANTCDKCKDGLKVKEFEKQLESTIQTVKWLKWIKIPKKDSKTENHEPKNYCNVDKVEKIGTLSELLNELYDLIPEFLHHEFIKIKQAEAAVAMIAEAMKPDAECAVIGCDFPEKFKCSEQNQVQSAHYGETPISLFSAAIYHRGFTAMVIASDFDKQTKDCILAYLDIILETLAPTAKRVDMWSDNATSQFKNQFIMEGLKSFQDRLNLKLRWNFYAAMHGKAVVDGIGGTAKRFVKDRMLSQHILVNSAKDFASTASTMTTKVVSTSASDVLARNETIGLNKIIKDAKPIAGISKHHFFEVKEVKKGAKSVTTKVVGQMLSPV